MSIENQAPDYIRAIAPYQGGRPIAEIARLYGFTEDSIVKLASNENPLGMSPKARQAMLDASADLGRYPDGNGHDLKLAISRRFDLPMDWITLGNGSNDILELVAHAFLRPGRESLYAAHSFAVYALATQANGGTSVVVPAKANDLGHDLDAMRAAVTSKTAVVWVANPNNPTGSFIEAKSLKAFIDGIPEDVLVVLDEAYTEYLEPSEHYDAFDWVRHHPNLLVSRSFSKAYGLAGLRVGYGVAQPAVTDLLNRVRQPFNVNSLAQAAASAALFDEEFLAESAALNREGLVQLSRGLRDLGLHVLPSRGNFVLVDLSTSASFVAALDAVTGDAGKSLGVRCFETLLAKGVITRPVANYGLPKHLRVSVGLREENAVFLDAMQALARGEK